MITIVDYGMGNLGSVMNMLKYLNIDSKIENKPSKIREAKKLILPGVGAFDHAIENINESGIKTALDHAVLDKGIPVLGICLGMQLLTNSSEEGIMPGLGYIPAVTKKFNLSEEMKVPHMGWNTLTRIHDSPMTKNLSENNKFYFVHSFYVEVEDPKHSLMKTEYGIEFCSSIHRDSIFGVQFHPEKSHKHGMIILKNFSDIKC